jgi:hypothetical protein
MLWHRNYPLTQKTTRTTCSKPLSKNSSSSGRQSRRSLRTLLPFLGSATSSSGSVSNLRATNSIPSNSVCRTASTKGRRDNESAQIAVILFFLLTVAFIAFYIFVVGGMMDQVTDIHNNLTQSGKVPLSQDRQDAMSQIQGAFNSLPIIAFILTIVSALIIALSSRYSQV